MYPSKEILEIISNIPIEYDNDYSKEKLTRIALRTFFSTGIPGVMETYYDTLRILREEWVKEITSVRNPFVLYSINRRIVAIRSIIKQGL